MKIYSGLETPGRRDSLAANMAWAGSVLAILMGQTQPKLASVSRNAHPALPALWPNILLAQSRLLRSHCDSLMMIILDQDVLFMIDIILLLSFACFALTLVSISAVSGTAPTFKTLYL